MSAHSSHPLDALFEAREEGIPALALELEVLEQLSEMRRDDLLRSRGSIASG